MTAVTTVVRDEDQPWLTEPDRLEWKDEATGLPCLIVRVSGHGALCGYVAVLPSHPWHGVNYSACANRPPCAEPFCNHAPDVRVEVHGGLTYSGRCQGKVCHVAAPGDVWWFGFDCAHLGDLTPERPERLTLEPTVYRDIGYVREQVTRLAQQLAMIAAVRDPASPQR